MQFTYAGLCTVSGAKPFTFGANYLMGVGNKSEVLTLISLSSDALTWIFCDVDSNGNTTLYSTSRIVNGPFNDGLATGFPAVTDAHIIAPLSDTDTVTNTYACGAMVDGAWTLGATGSYTAPETIHTGATTGGSFAGALIEFEDASAFISAVNSITDGNQVYNGAPAQSDITSTHAGIAIDANRAITLAGICDPVTLALVDTIDAPMSAEFTGVLSANSTVWCFSASDTNGVYTALLFPGSNKAYRLDLPNFMAQNMNYGVSGSAASHNFVYYELNFPSTPRAVYPAHLLVPLPSACIPLCEDYT